MVALHPLRVDVDASPVYELLLQLAVFVGREELGTFDVGPRWRSTQAVRCAPRVRRALERLGGASASWGQLLGLQATTGSASVPAFLELIDQTDPEEIQLHMLGFYAGSIATRFRDAIPAAIQGNGKARTTILEASEAEMPGTQAALRRLIATPPATVKDLVLDVLSGWYERIFSKDEAAVTTLLQDEARARSTLRATDPERLILIATGVRYVGQPGIDTVLLVPTLIMRPWLGVENYRHMRIYCYPILDDPELPDAVPPALVRTYQALANPARLRILKALGDENLTVEQLASRLGDQPDAIRAHLARLRVGRLVEIICADDATYARRTDLLRVVGQPLRSYLQLRTTSS
ncbi:MAG TPA: winged helix-turn-helix domain-containing protein [Candidatus Limnocylindrales bacterium]|nr:winged helix-turn-helix domain-containing protein [Candidatus Limnocylindrales bacterium]